MKSDILVRLHNSVFPHFFFPNLVRGFRSPTNQLAIKKNRVLELNLPLTGALSGHCFVDS